MKFKNIFLWFLENPCKKLFLLNIYSTHELPKTVNLNNTEHTSIKKKKKAKWKTMKEIFHTFITGFFPLKFFDISLCCRLIRLIITGRLSVTIIFIFIIKFCVIKTLLVRELLVKYFFKNERFHLRNYYEHFITLYITYL